MAPTNPSLARAKGDLTATKPSRASLKRQREEKLREYGIDLPNIPGLSIAIIPLHVHAIKATTRLVHMGGYQHTALPLDVTLDDACVVDRVPTSATVLDSILLRVDRSQSRAAVSDRERERLRDVRQRYQDALQAWLQAIHAAVGRRKDSSRRPVEQNANQRPAYVTNAPEAALQHLLFGDPDDATASDGHTSNSSVAASRSRLHLAGKLLERSADCRKWFLESQSRQQLQQQQQLGTTTASQPLVDWMDALVTKPESGSSPELIACLRLWQREGYLLLQHLDSKGYGDYYPTLSVALLRFQQLCHASVVENQSDFRGRAYHHHQMCDWRRIRDRSMDHSQKLSSRLVQLTRQAQHCMDVLVPRLLNPLPTNTNDRGAEEINTSDNDDEEEDIEWEDAWDDPSPDLEDFPESAIYIGNHLAAVERTMEVMQSTGGLKEGILEISFGNDQESSYLTEKPSEKVTQVRERLDMIVKMLTERYMPRLSLWVEALTRADSLVESSSMPSSNRVTSLISMSSDALRRRREALKQCVEWKGEISRIVASAKRLGIESLPLVLPKGAEQTRRRPPPVVADLIGARQNQSLSSNLSRKRFVQSQDMTRARSNRIRIKFTKRYR
jgi:hypothetical protein